MPQAISIVDFLVKRSELPVLDVRSEGEFESGHIPGAINIPLMENDERVAVGTTYKHNGREAAVLKGLELTGPHLKDRLKHAVRTLDTDEVLVHCWRGGMRSEFFATLLGMYGLRVFVLEGGYKAFRRHAHQHFERSWNFRVLSGHTGSGKTDILNALAGMAQVIDLEGLAHHRGSSFGGLGMDEITQEQFENDLADRLMRFDPQQPIWIENENRTIGTRVIPEGIWQQMISAPRFEVQRTFDERLDQLMHDYAGFPRSDLRDAMERIGKRLGPQHVKRALELLDEGMLREAFAIALRYYDKAYDFHKEKYDVPSATTVNGTGRTAEEIAMTIKDIN